MLRLRPVFLFCTLLISACPRGNPGTSVADAAMGPASGPIDPATSGGGEQAGQRILTALTTEEFFAELQFSPTTASFLGDHRFDDRLDDVRAEALGREIGRLRALAERVRRLEQPSLDKRLLAARIESLLFELAELRPHEKNPLYYINLIAYGIDSLLQPEFVPLEARVRTLALRLSAVPELCKEAQRNLKNPPELATRRAIEVAQNTRGALLLLPRLLRSVTDPRLLEDFNRSSEDARRALDELIGFLSKDLLARSRGEWVLSRERLQARLQAVELLDVPLDVVQAAAEAELSETRARLEGVAQRETAKEPQKDRPSSLAHLVQDALRVVEEDHPGKDELLRAAEAAIATAFERLGGVVALPGARPRVLEMPPYRWGYAQLFTPGPLENRARDALFYIDPVDPSWTDKKLIAEHLRVLNRTQLLLTVLHEVVPGHLAQQEALRQQTPLLSLIRQRTRSLAFVEGWALSMEEWVAETWDGPEKDHLLLLVLRQKLVRFGRLIAVLRLHQGNAAKGEGHFEEVLRFFAEECLLDEHAARKETERAALDPMTLLPALGWMQVQKLHHDYKEQEGDAYTLRGFTDALLSKGELPVVALRQLLLTDPKVSLVAPEKTQE